MSACGLRASSPAQADLFAPVEDPPPDFGEEDEPDEDEPDDDEEAAGAGVEAGVADFSEEPAEPPAGGVELLLAARLSVR